MPTEQLTGRRLLVVNTGSEKKKFTLQRLKKLGLHLVALNQEKKAWATPYVDEWILADTQNHLQSLQAIETYCQDNQVEGVVTFWEDDVLLTSKIVDQFNLIGISHQIAAQARNKHRFREFCRVNQLPFPRFTRIPPNSSKLSLPEEIRFPVVVKPAFGSSSAYVIKVSDQAELQQTIYFVQKNLSTDIESALLDGSDILVEEYIDGEEVDIDIILQNGKVKFHSISDNFSTREPYFVEAGQSIPSHLPIQAQTALVELAEETLEKLGITNGIIHFEAKSTKNGPVPIEVNLRMGGDEVHSFVKNAWRVDLVEYAAKVALGVHIPRIHRPDTPYKYLAGKYFLPEDSGVLANIDIPKSIAQQSFVHELLFTKEIGDPILAPPGGYEYLGWVTVTGDNHLDAADNLDAVYQKIKYDVVRFGPDSNVGRTKRSSRFGSATIQKNLLIGAARFEKIRQLDIAEQRGLHIGIAANLYDNGHNPMQTDMGNTARDIEQTLIQLGYKARLIDFNHLSSAISTLKQHDVDLVINVCQEINSSRLLEPHAASLLDMLQIPYTGSNPFTLGLCMDKIRVKKLLSYHNIPTPNWDYAYTLGDKINPDLTYPLIVKPANTDSSIGLTNDSIVSNPAQLSQQLEKVISEMGRPALVEEYIAGDEYDIAILGTSESDLEVLPLTRYNFAALPESYWHIFSFDAKWGIDPVYSDKIDIQRPARRVREKLLSLLTEIALDTYNILDCHDYGRVEMRVDQQGNPYVLELNPNTSIRRGDGLAETAQLIGLDYGALLERIIALAIGRIKNRPQYDHLQANQL